MEQGDTYAQWQNNANLSYYQMVNANLSLVTVGVKNYLCPTRPRQGAIIFNDGVPAGTENASSGYYSGPCGDYGFCIGQGTPINNQNYTFDNWTTAIGAGPGPGYFQGAFTSPGNGWGNGKLRFADVTDGLSNTIFMGEKFCAVINGPEYGSAYGQSQFATCSSDNDCCLYDSFDPTINQKAAGPLVPLNGNPNVDPPNYFGGIQFGGYHPSITMFVMGDGRVVAIQNSIDGTTLGNLSCINDGNPITSNLFQ
jgi:hypothetical protein